MNRSNYLQRFAFRILVQLGVTPEKKIKLNIKSGSGDLLTLIIIICWYLLTTVSNVLLPCLRAGIYACSGFVKISLFTIQLGQMSYKVTDPWFSFCQSVQYLKLLKRQTSCGRSENTCYC